MRELNEALSGESATVAERQVTEFPESATPAEREVNLSPASKKGVR